MQAGTPFAQLDFASTRRDRPHRHHHHHFSDALQAQYASLARETLILNYVAVAALAWIAYDFILCFQKELLLVWGRWNVQNGRHARRVYVAVRYTSLVFLSAFAAVNTSESVSLDLSPLGSRCNAWYYILVVMAVSTTLLSNSLLLIRINATYKWDIKVLGATAFAFFVQLISGLAIGFLTVSTSDTSLNPAGIPGCFIGDSSVGRFVTLAAWIPSILAHCAYLALMLRHVSSGLTMLDSAAPSSENTSDRTLRERVKEMRDLMPTMILSMKHGIAYFSITIAAQVANVVLIVTQHGPLQGLGIPLMMAIYVVVGCRIYLHLISFIYEQPEDEEQMDGLTFM